MKATVFNFTKNGLEQAKTMPTLPIGTRVYSFGGGMSESIWAVMSDVDERGNYKVVKISKHYDDDYFCNPFNTLDKYSRPIEKKFGIGFYYDLSHTFKQSEIDEAINRANETIERQKQAKIDKENNDKAERESLPKLYPYLTVNPQNDMKILKQNMFAILKHNFPNQKFSIKKEDYDCYYVRWVDGVNKDAVSSLMNKFNDHKTDFTGDYRDYDPSNFNRVFGGVNYIFEERQYSEKIEAYILTLDYNQQREFNSKLWKKDIPANFESILFEGGVITFIMPKQPDKPITPEQIEVVKPEWDKMQDFINETDIKLKGFQIVDYSDKAIAVIGNTKPIKDLLKELGGRFNMYLSCGAGWIFPKAKRSEVEKLLLTA